MMTGWALCSKWFFSLCSKWKEKTSEPSNCFFRWHRTTTGKGVNPAAHWIIIKGDAIAGAWWSAWTMMISVMAATTMMIKSTWRRTVSPSKLSPAATLVNSLSPDRGGQLAWGVSWFVFFLPKVCWYQEKVHFVFQIVFLPNDWWGSSRREWHYCWSRIQQWDQVQAQWKRLREHTWKKLKIKHNLIQIQAQEDWEKTHGI